jgi:hypothetical protein
MAMGGMSHCGPSHPSVHSHVLLLQTPAVVEPTRQSVNWLNWIRHTVSLHVPCTHRVEGAV